MSEEIRKKAIRSEETRSEEIRSEEIRSEETLSEETRSVETEAYIPDEIPVVISAETPADGVTEAVSEKEIRPAAQDEPEERRPKGRYLVAFLAGFAVCIALLCILTYGLGLGRIMSKGDWDYYSKLDDNYGKYAEIMRMIGEDPLSQTVPEEISDDVLKEIVASTGDPYAQYFTAKEYEQFSKTYSGGYVGIGIGVEYSEGEVIVMTVYDDGPADEAGMKPGDVILRVDGVVPKDLDDAVARMTGEKNTEVTVTVRRDGEEIDLTMTRDEISLDSVGYAVSEDDPSVGYIRISLFSKNTDKEFKNAVKDLKNKGCDKFILDLRDNGGGLTDISVEIADYLLPACKIMTDVTKSGSETVYNSDDKSADLKLVVLVNGNTASASEILTAALKENNAATIIGSRTYGKGVTQISRMFSDGSAAKLTVSEYLTPKGNHVNDNGIEPDIEATDEDILDIAIEELNK